jgi:hypothetical protein
MRPLSPIRKKGRAAPPSFDCILLNRTVVNHDGVGLRDIVVRDGRVAELGGLERRRGGRARRLPGAAHPARNHRFASAFSMWQGELTAPSTGEAVRFW